MTLDSLQRKVTNGRPVGVRLRGQPRIRRLDDVEYDLLWRVVKRYRTKAADREDFYRKDSDPEL